MGILALIPMLIVYSIFNAMGGDFHGISIIEKVIAIGGLIVKR